MQEQCAGQAIGQTPLDTALSRALSNRFGRLLGRGQDNRIEPECWPDIAPSFHITRNQSFFVIGSCFAHNLGRYLAGEGYCIQGSLAEEGIARDRSTPAAIWQELAWAKTIFQRDDLVTEADIAPLLIEIEPGRWDDLWSRSDHGQRRDRAGAIAERKALYAHFRGAFLADVVVLAFPQIEAWWDSVSRSYVEFDKGWARRPDRDRFAFEQLGFETCKDFIERTVGLLADGRRRLLLTVSPQMLGRTFMADDVIVASTHAKAVLRAAAGEVAAAHPDVDYFPGYEIATITRRPEVWEQDLLHLSPSFTARIMQHVVAAYAPGSVDETARALLHFADLVEGAQLDEAEAVLARRLDDVCASTDHAVQIAALRFYTAREAHAAALPFAAKLAQAEAVLAPAHPDWLFEAALAIAAAPDHATEGETLLARFAADGAVHPHRLYTTFVRLKRKQKHAGLARLIALAEPLDFDLPAFAAWLATKLMEMREPERARALCLRHLAAAPNDIILLARCARTEIACGALANACATLEALMLADPKDQWARLALARVLVKRNQEVAALAVLAELDRLMPDHAPGLTLAARLLWKACRHEDAVAMAQRARAASGDDPATAELLSGIMANEPQAASASIA